MIVFDIYWVVYGLQMTGIVTLAAAPHFARWVVNRYPPKLISSGAASPARRISSTDPANGDPGEANT